ncbi:hypothetical protein VZT92_012295 [Zoarces viviparus]|uniref:Uncharacterized protein n=1 Tax=Zoarces viviparus TaxID=48416 RepID=A0AAW1F8J0_ZOAVI
MLRINTLAPTRGLRLALGSDHEKMIGICIYEEEEKEEEHPGDVHTDHEALRSAMHSEEPPGLSVGRVTLID